MLNPVILFDACCELCSRSVRFIMKRDPDRYFRFMPISSDEGKELLAACGFNPEDIQGLVLVEENGCLWKSDAVLAIARRLSGPWPGAYIFRFLPHFIRDAMYHLIAKNRYRIFGKKTCPIPRKINSGPHDLVSA